LSAKIERARKKKATLEVNIYDVYLQTKMLEFRKLLNKKW
jgi:hypothetical protein